MEFCKNSRGRVLCRKFCIVHLIYYTDETRDRKEMVADHKRNVYKKLFSAVVYGRRLKWSGDPQPSYDGGV